ncbi:MAG: lipid II:glycine glycyltransferase FemX, partial [Candidatus Limnocylindrales bacterium]
MSDLVAFDAAAWDGFVAGLPLATYLQLSAWARVKAANGWLAQRVISGIAATTSDAAGPAPDAPAALVGAQVLLRRPRGVPWAFGYAPRGPLAARLDGASLAVWTAALRRERWPDRVSHVRIDPEIESGGPLDTDGGFRDALRATGWRTAPEIQPHVTRIVDLRPDEAALWSDLRAKWRQYVRQAERAGVRVVDGDASRLDEFHAVMRETA